MKPPSFLNRFHLSGTSLVALTFALLHAAASATTMYWDGSADTALGSSDNTTTSILDWLSGGLWDNGTTSEALASWTSGDSAVFGGTAASETINGGTFTVGNLTFGGGALGANTTGTSYTITGGTLTLSASTITTNTHTTISSVLGGTTGLVKTGSATLILTGSNNYTGGTTISAGTLQVGNAAVNGTIGTGTYAVAGGATLFLNYATAVAPSWSNITGAGTLRLNSAQPTRVDWAQLNLPAGFTGTLRIDNGRVYGNSTRLGGATAVVVNAGSQFLTYDTAGGNMTYNQSFTIAGNGWDAGDPHYAAALRLGGANNVVAGAITLSANASIMSGHDTTMITGSITGAYELELFNNAAYPFIHNLTPAAAVQNSYGSTKVTGGAIVKAGNAYAFSTGGLLMNGGKIQLNGNNFSFANLSGAGGEVQNGNATTAAVVSAGSDNTNTTYGGTLVNGSTATLGLTKTGTGTLTLTGASTYTGVTTITGGTLKLGTGGSIVNSSTLVVGGPGSTNTVLDTTALAGLTINSNQILKGIGQVNVGSAKTLTINGTHAPGNSPGLQAITGNTSYSSGSVFAWDLSGDLDGDTSDSGDTGTRGVDYDAVNITGNLTINSAAIFKVIQNSGVNFTTGFWNSNQKWTDIFNYTGSLTSGWSNSAVSVYDTSGVLQNVGSQGYFTMTGTTLSWTAVPEPSSALAGILLGFGLVRRRRDVQF